MSRPGGTPNPSPHSSLRSSRSCLPSDRCRHRHVGLLQRHLTSQIDDSSSRPRTRSDLRLINRFAADGQEVPHPLYYVRHSRRMARVATSEDTLKASGIHPARADRYFLAPSPPSARCPSQSPPQRPDSAGAHSSSPSTTKTPVILRIRDRPPCPTSSLHPTASYFCVAGLIIVIIGGWAGHVLVTRAPTTLRSIESTAGKIAAGDH